MKTNSRLSIAVHALVLTYLMDGAMKITGDAIAGSEQVNPVIVRGVLSSLKKAEIVEIPPGTGGARPLLPPDRVTLYDIYAAVNDVQDIQLFGFHNCEKSRCPVAVNMHEVLDKHFADAENAVRRSLEAVTMKDILRDMQEGCGVSTEQVLRTLGA